MTKKEVADKFNAIRAKARDDDHSLLKSEKCDIVVAEEL